MNNSKLSKKNILHPVRTAKALYFVKKIYMTDQWKRMVEREPKKAVDMMWNRVYREKFPWDNPQTMNEKITWLSVMTDTSKWSEYSDKYQVREYIKSLGLGDTLTECYGVWDDIDDVDFESLPQSFVLKCTHDCDSTVIVRNKKEVDMKSVKAFLRGHLSERYGYDCCEPHYTLIKPRVMAESIIEFDDSDKFSSSSAVDYKFRCIDGKAQYVFVCYDRKLGSSLGGGQNCI